MLELDRTSLRIECYDVSHTQGTHQVALIVISEGGLARKTDYRYFIVHGPDGKGAVDDMAVTDEVPHRRLTRLLAGAAGDDTDVAEDEDRGNHTNASGETETPCETESARKVERVPEAEKSFGIG